MRTGCYSRSGGKSTAQSSIPDHSGVPVRHGRCWRRRQAPGKWSLRLAMPGLRQAFNRLWVVWDESLPAPGGRTQLVPAATAAKVESFALGRAGAN